MLVDHIYSFRNRQFRSLMFRKAKPLHRCNAVARFSVAVKHLMRQARVRLSTAGRRCSLPHLQRCANRP